MAPSHVRVSREAAREVVDRGSVGQPLSSEITYSGVPTALAVREGKTVYDVKRRVMNRPHGVEDPVHAWTLYAREPGDLRSFPSGNIWRVG